MHTDHQAAINMRWLLHDLLCVPQTAELSAARVTVFYFVVPVGLWGFGGSCPRRDAKYNEKQVAAGCNIPLSSVVFLPFVTSICIF